ncbi:MAG TPA: YbaB/EbfC family nucleoid-associated protein [Pseudonocardiaceae bacterium]|nr:YbaB/EbfC family nucleoid-associated protein [Pseudonocardiaceae bacterium]
MTITVEGTARSADGSIRVTVGPGGMLRGLEIRPAALDRGGRWVADTVLDLVRVATAAAGERARHQLRDELDGLPPEALAALGFATDERLVEEVESTVPLTWQDL